MDLILFWTKRAKSDLQNIYSFYKEEASMRVAKELIQGIRKSALQLCDFPYIGPKEERLSHRKKDFRYLVKGNYKIIYWVNEKENRVEIASIFDCRQDPGKMNIIKEPAQNYSKPI